MEDPPPEDPSGLPPPAAVSPLLSQPELAGSAIDGVSSDQPHHFQPELAGSAMDNVSSDRPLLHEESARSPLAEMNVNGELVSGDGVASKNMQPNRISTGAPRLKIKTKKKSNSKLLPYPPLPHGDATLKKLKEDVGRAAVVQPLQLVAALDSPTGDDDDDWSEEEEEEDDFDFESLQFDESRRAELASLMERYEVYDEEQLRLALPRKKTKEV